MSSKLGDYDYPLPEELIAKRPLPHRDDSRMMILHRDSETMEHRQFRELKGLLSPGDLLVLNNTRVLPARRFLMTMPSSSSLEKLAPGRWKCLVKPGRKLRLGAISRMDNVELRVAEILPDGERIVAFEKDIDPYARGSMPLPPYIGRESDLADTERYQTVFAQTPGAVAAPTAGLHFTSEILSEVPHAFVTLHVGSGTFRPVHAENVAEHEMHAESFTISEEAAAQINRAQRVVAVGTTTVRVLESISLKTERVVACSGETNLFIYPPFKFRVVDALLTNFHLPRSTLLMLVSAFAGREFLLRGYAEAIRKRYRFYSYGDCMLIL